MSVNPFKADPAIRTRVEWLEQERGAAVREAVHAALAEAPADPGNLGGVVEARAVGQITHDYQLSVDELMLLSLGVAQRLANPSISGFTVGAAGLETETGNLVLGGNLEFERANIANTVHGEGFVFARAFSRGTSIGTIAIGEAHPCAFCRQFLSEFAASQSLVLIDPLGHRLTMGELYPWPFDPDYLGESGIVAGEVRHPGLRLGPHGLPGDVADAITAAGRRSYVPYGKAPAAVALRLRNGTLLCGAAIESVSFNPTMHPLPAACIDLVAHGGSTADIASAVLAVVPGAPVDYVHSTRDLLSALAPAAGLTVVAWA